MRLTTRGRYAVTAMLDLALHDGEGRAVTLADVARRQDISLSYLGQLFAQLRKQGLVISQRGPGGGYSLAKPMEDISIADIMTAVDESVDSTRCGGSVDCRGGERCIAHGLWESLGHRIYDFLAATSLAKVVADHEALEAAQRREVSSETSVTLPLRNGHLLRASS